MNTTIRAPALLWIFFSLVFLLAPAAGFSQETEAANEPAPQERNIFADTGYAALGVITSNFSLNLFLRMANQPYSHTTFETMGGSLFGGEWFWEDGDRFVVNQLGHPYQGSMYFASARVNGFNFYESTLFNLMGGLMWEAICEPNSTFNDVISSTTGGIALGEMLHRLFLEADSSPSTGAKAGGFLISPMSSFNKVYNRPARESGGGNIYAVSIKSGVEKTFAFLPGHGEQSDAWNYPGGYFDVNVVYGDPFVQRSKIPYEHFELYTGLVTNTTSFHETIVSDGYLFSFTPAQTDTISTSTGLSLHFDFFNAANNIVNNSDYGNIQFSANSLDWTAKSLYRPSEKYRLELKAHAGVILWGNTMYISDIVTDDYWVPLENAHNTYGLGENIKLYFTVSHTIAGKLEFVLLGYHIFAIPMNKRFSAGNVFFLYSSLDYEFPLTAKLGIGAKVTFEGLLGLYASAEKVNRSLFSHCLYARFTFR
jgi:hypothetical protein